MKLQLAKQRMQELEKDIEEKEEKFLRSIHEQDWDSSPDAEDESSLTDFESGARWISVICKEKKDESTKISDQVRSLTSSLSSCKGQGESAGNSLRRLLPSLRENLLRASKYTPLTGKTSSSSSSSFSSHTKKHSLSSSSSSIWPIHLLHERKGENPPHRRDALPDDLSNPFFFKKHKTLSSSSSSLASRSQEYCFIPDEEILVQDSSLVLSVCTEGLRKRREKDIGEEINVLRREEVKVSELLTGQGGTGRGGAAGGSVCIQGWLLDMKEQSERDHACAFCKREFLLDEEILQMQKEVEMKVQAVPAQIQKLRLRQEEIRDALPQLQEEMHVIQSIEKQSEEVQKTLQVLQTLQQ
ncbi:smc n terminal domain-containing protein, partial [Cystoisospora suis]